MAMGLGFWQMTKSPAAGNWIFAFGFWLIAG